MSPEIQDTWTIQRLLAWTQDFFKSKGITSPRLDAELLLAQALGQSRIYLYTHFDQPLTHAERQAFKELVKRRAAREPVAYILGQREFYGRTFCVNGSVLIPRPETEHLIDAVLDWVKSQQLVAPRILDLGTGSGNIAITLALEIPGATVTAIELSNDALVVARQNGHALGAENQITWVNGDLFTPLGPAAVFDIVVSNPPYIDPAGKGQLEPEVRDFEPASALFSLDAGMGLIYALCANVFKYLTSRGLLAFEIGFDQETRACEAVVGTGIFSKVETRRDLQGHPRVVLAERT